MWLSADLWQVFKAKQDEENVIVRLRNDDEQPVQK